MRFPLPKGEGRVRGKRISISERSFYLLRDASFPLIPAFAFGEKQTTFPASVEQ